MSLLMPWSITLHVLERRAELISFHNGFMEWWECFISKGKELYSPDFTLCQDSNINESEKQIKYVAACQLAYFLGIYILPDMQTLKSPRAPNATLIDFFLFHSGMNLCTWLVPVLILLSFGCMWVPSLLIVLCKNIHAIQVLPFIHRCIGVYVNSIYPFINSLKLYLNWEKLCKCWILKRWIFWHQARLY